MLESECVASASHAGLDLVADQQCVMVRSQLAGQRGEFRRNLDDAPFSQDGLEHDGSGLLAHCGFECREIVGSDEAHARNYRLEGLAVLGLAGHGDRAQRAAAEGFLQRDNLGLVAAAGAAVPLRDLHGRFDGFRTAVAEERALQAAQLR